MKKVLNKGLIIWMATPQWTVEQALQAVKQPNGHRGRKPLFEQPLELDEIETTNSPELRLQIPGRVSASASQIKSLLTGK